MSFVLKRHSRLHLEIHGATVAYSTARTGSHEKVTIPVGTSGRIQLEYDHGTRSIIIRRCDICANTPLHHSIHHPPRPPTSRPRILLHLPSNPNVTAAVKSQSHAIAHSLSQTANATTITAHYRLSPLHQYPTPTHDVVAAYDWIVQNLVPRRGSGADVAITGSLVGGSLALALGLTECHLDTNKARITAIAAHNPIVDWVFESDAAFRPHSLDATPRGKQRSASSTTNTNESDDGPSAQTSEQIARLHRLRATAFPSHKPARYFDPYATPVHFLRSPSRAAPPSTPAPPLEGPVSAAEAEFEALVGLDVPPSRKVVPPTVAGSGSSDDSAGHDDEDEDGKVDGRRFRRALRWPPTGSALLVPRVRVSVREGSVLVAQGEEMVRLLRKVREREGGAGGRGIDEQEVGAVRLCVDAAGHGDGGIGDVLGSEGSEGELRARGEWLGEALDV